MVKVCFYSVFTVGNPAYNPLNFTL